MTNFLKKLVGRLLVYFGGLLTVLGAAGLFAGSGSTLLILGIFGIGFLMVVIGIAIRLI